MKSLMPFLEPAAANIFFSFLNFLSRLKVSYERFSKDLGPGHAKFL